MTSIAKKIFQQIREITVKLITLSLCDQQNSPSLQNGRNGYQEIGIGGHHDMSFILKNIPYHDIYTELDRTQTYNLKMLDGALIQMMYCFRKNNIESYRLAFFSSPTLEEFQNNPEIYREDEIYADVISKHIVPFPLRFDFDSTCAIEIEHPKSHLTLGQYKNCRIPVSAPLMPSRFITFILMNFYNPAFQKYSDKIQPIVPSIFTETITDKEKKLVYVHVPP